MISLAVLAPTASGLVSSCGENSPEKGIAPLLSKEADVFTVSVSKYKIFTVGEPVVNKKSNVVLHSVPRDVIYFINDTRGKYTKIVQAEPELAIVGGTVKVIDNDGRRNVLVSGLLTGDKIYFYPGKMIKDLSVSNHDELKQSFLRGSQIVPNIR